MPENKCTGRYVRETQIFWKFVHVDGEKEYKHMISKIKKDWSAPEGEHLSTTPCADKV